MISKRGSEDESKYRSFFESFLTSPPFSGGISKLLSTPNSCHLYFVAFLIKSKSLDTTPGYTAAQLNAAFRCMK